MPGGSRLGPYEIVAPLGAGGMGEVYRARDARLGREVALKVLPTEFAENRERRQRFEQEARAASALNHPNIVVVFDIGDEQGTPFLVTELVDGESLRKLLERGPLRVRRALEIASQLAEGMGAAHAAGIVHRDLKPENVMVTREGRVKILDFGLAKQAPPAATSDATSTALGATQPGTVMGTAGYMSPEQVQGRPADPRSDIFSFGAILYEMVAGRRAFEGATAIESMSAILKDEPPELPAGLPPAVESVIRHCLEKEPRRRFQSAQDLAFGLQALVRTGGSGAAPAVAGPTKRRRWVSAAAGAALLIAGSLAGLAAGRGFWKSDPPTFRKVSFGRGTVSNARFGPDGRTVLFSAVWQGARHEIYTTRVESPESRSLGLEGASLFSISSTGEMAVALEARSHFVDHFMGRLARVPLSGGAPRVLLADVAEAEWAPDGENLAVAHAFPDSFRLEYPIGKVLYETPGWISYLRFSPRGDRIAFIDHPAPSDNRGRVAVIDLAGKKTILSDGWNSLEGLSWSARGDEVWFAAARSGGWPKSIYGVAPGREPRAVVRLPTSMRLVDIRSDGRVLLTSVNIRSEMLGVSAEEKRERNLAWLDQPLPRDLSDDGKTLLFVEQGEAMGANPAVYIRKTDGSPAVRLGEGAAQALSPNGKWALTWLVAPSTQVVLLPTGEGQPVRLATAGLVYRREGACWLPDSRRILFQASEPQRGSRLWVQDIAGGAPRAASPEGVALAGKALSPDGKLAAARGPDGALGLYPLDGGAARPLPGVAPAEDIVRWSGDGRRVYVYDRAQTPTPVHRVDVSSGRRELLRTFAPADPTGVFRLGRTLLTPSGDGVVFGFTRVLSELYLVEGLR